jgi:beta-glucosidase
VLLGRADPSGRLAESIPLRLEDTPSHLTFPGQDGEVVYGDDIYVGYRSYDTLNTPVAYPFGHGLSYTSFAYDDITVESVGVNRWRVRVAVRNSGERAGAEVVQLYVASEVGGVRRPAHELRGFAKVHLQPGEMQTVTIEIGPRDLSFWNARASRWQIEQGAHRIEVGSSSRNIRLSAAITSDGDGVVDPLREDSTLAEWVENPASAAALESIKSRLPVSLATTAPELIAMVRATPVMKFTAWGLGITVENVRDMIAHANATLDEQPV